MNLCNDFFKGRCRRGFLCRFFYYDVLFDVFDRGFVDDYRSRDIYYDRNYDREFFKRGEILCKFFVVGNCRNGNYCRFFY